MPRRDGLTPARPPRSPRLFVALLPDATARAGLAGWQRRLAGPCGGRAVVAGHLHMTLKFLGPVPLSREDEVFRLVERLPPPNHVVRLDRVAFWPRPAVPVATAARPPTALLRFAEDLEAAFAEAGFAPETRPFSPHCTLFRHALRGADAPCDPIHWRIQGMVVVASVPGPGGVCYRVRRRVGGLQANRSPNGWSEDECGIK